MLTRHIIFQLFLVGCLQAQVSDTLLRYADELHQKTSKEQQFPATNYLAEFPFNFYIKKKSLVNDYKIKLKELESKQFLQDIGLVFKASTNYNFRDAFDEEQNSFNKFRFRTELEWNILKNGFTHNRTKALQKLNEAEHLKLQNNRVKKQLWRRQFRIDYSYIANKEALLLFNSFLNFENNYFDFLNKLYVQSLIKRERLIEVGNQIHILKNQLIHIQKKNTLLKDSISNNALLIEKLPIFKIRIDSMYLSAQAYNNDFLQENIKLNHRAINDLNLSFYINQNFNHSLTRNQYFPAVGIRFKAPIRFNKRQQIVKTKLQLLAAQERNKNVGQYNRLITHMNSYNEIIKDLQNQYKNWKVVEERIRVFELLKEEYDNFKTGLLILELTEEKFKILENCIQLRRQLCTALAQLFELYPKENLHEILVPYSFEENNQQQPILFTQSDQHNLDFQYEFIKTQQQFYIHVLKQDTEIQLYLRSKKIAFKIVNKAYIKTIEQVINKELKQLAL
ncbi:hypothetical protein [Tenacibaculum sp. 190130A14a]|uniref:hypothetical protein n=1 Tax=Tenacibaculum polynesiense TaxID=3137857 RepID=UPI0032B22852